MSSTFIESGFEFTFPAGVAVRELDKLSRPSDMKAVDFVVCQGDNTLLLEVKNPSSLAIPQEHRASRAATDRAKRVGDELINNELVPKARHSYLYLHLMEEDTERLILVFLDDPGALGIDAALLVNYKDRLLGRLRQEADAPWKREYISDCVVVTPETWATYFPDYTLSPAP
ncbi:MAG: hypothetical protein KBI47_08305 [Armatimonadetes bacterium]|nr:hypothetical protein [Armatimonadota bacterium]MDI9583867.1 hypothetical protein [Acidobacteriota bacterium]